MLIYFTSTFNIPCSIFIIPYPCNVKLQCIKKKHFPSLRSKGGVPQRPS